jgi:steroid delta-isomerase-like uncharacterized protein
MLAISPERTAARIALVDEHIAHENRHDLESIVGTFGQAATYEDRAWSSDYHGHAEVRGFYRGLLEGLPDVQIDVQHRHAAGDAVVVEVLIQGTHLGPWRGLPATGRRVVVPLCAIFTFDEADRLAGERIYYDRATVLAQLGVLHEPESLRGQLATMLMHPLTMARIAWRRMTGA